MIRKTVNHLREYIIALLIPIVLILIGSKFDFRISESLFGNRIDDSSWFGIIGCIITEWPFYFAMFFAGMLGFLLTPKNINKFWWFCSKFVSICAIICGPLFSIWNSFKLGDFQIIVQNEWLKWLIVGLNIVIVAPIIFFLVKTSLKVRNGKNLMGKYIFSISIILLFAVTFALSLALKYIVSRPRPIFIFGLENYEGPIDVFKNWFEPQPFKAFTSDDFTSFPSQHSLFSCLSIFAVPGYVELFAKEENKKKFKISLFYLLLIYAIVGGFSRMCAGAHFMSDVGWGLLMAILFSVAFDYVYTIIYKEKYGVVYES